MDLKKIFLFLAFLFCAGASFAQTPPLQRVNAKYLGWAGVGGGTANAQTVTYSPATTALSVGQAVAWQPAAANTTAATLNVDGLGAVPIKKANGSALIANDLITTAIAQVVYDGTNFELINPQTVFSGTVPCAALPALTQDVTTSAGSCATTVVQVENGAIPVNAPGLGTNANGQLIATTPSSTLPGPYVGPQAVAGCGVEWTGGLNFTVGACQYIINGVTYNSPITNLTLSAADPTNPRFDVIYVDTTSTAQVLAGTPAGSPAVPTTDPSTQLSLDTIRIDAGATTPTNVSKIIIYDENTEWTTAVGGTNSARVNVASTNNPYHGSVDVEFGNGGTVAGTTFVSMTDPAAGTVDLAASNFLTFYIRNKAAWPNKRSITVQWFNGSTAKGTAIVISSGAYGFDSTTNTTTYQQINIPTSAFGINGVPVTTVRFTVTGTGAALTGFYLDLETLQAGVTPPVVPTTIMNFKGTWSSAVTYQPNDYVLSGGITYVALVQNTNVAVTTTSTWAPSVTALPNGVTATTQAATDNSTKVATTAYVTTGISNAIAGVNPAVAVQAATAAVLPNSPTYNNGVAGIGAFLTTASTNTALVVDGYTPVLLDRILVKNQASAFQNGVYYVSQVSGIGVAWILTRALDYDQPSDINNTGAIPVVNGTANATTQWVITSSVTTVGTDSLTYTQFSLAPSSIVTASSNFVIGNLIQGVGANKTSSDSGIATANVCAPNGYTAQTDAATVTWAIGSNMCRHASLLFTVHSGSRTLNLTGMVASGDYILRLTQDSTGGEGLTLGTGCTWKVSGGGSGAVTLSTGANAIDVLAWSYDGTNCLANLNKNFN